MRKDKACASFCRGLYAEGITCGGDIVECKANEIGYCIRNEWL